MHVASVGLTPVKGCAHTDLSEVRLEPHGPVGDRVFCLVDPVGRQVVRTAQHPETMRLRTTWDGVRLTVRDPGAGREVDDEPVVEGALTAGYWGRRAHLHRVRAPAVQALLADAVGRDVVLCRVARPGEVVYGAAVSLVTTSSLAALAREAGLSRGPAGLATLARRFRSTLVLDTTNEPGDVEASWVGREVSVGDATLRVRAPIPRCTVIETDPSDPRMDSGLLGVLPRYRRADSGPCFGVDAEVVRPGTVRPGDRVEGA